MPRKPEGPLKKSARLLQLGISLGIGAFIVGTPLTMRVMLGASDIVDDLGTHAPLVAAILRALLANVTVLVVAPVVAYAAAYLLEAPPLLIGTTMVFVIQFASTAIALVSLGSELVVNPFNATMLAVTSVAGLVLCAFGHKLGLDAIRERERAKKAAQQTPSIPVVTEALQSAAQADAVAVPAPAPDAPAASIAPVAVAKVKPPEPQG